MNALVSRILSSAQPRASSFIVTIYGDVVEPRGNVLWMGTLIECCARHGISESLVRTAVSRLVAAGRLEGERIGRHLPGAGDLVDFAARHWPLAEVAAAYRLFLKRFAPAEDPAGLAALTDDDALALRLRLVDEYRHAALADPRLPAEATPADWPAGAARDLFRRLYLHLSPAADRWIGHRFADADGLLPESTPETLWRLQNLRVV